MVDQCGFDPNHVSPQQVAKNCSMPGLFIHAVDDTFIPSRHSQAIFQGWIGEKILLEVSGDHFTDRPVAVSCHAARFFYLALGSEMPPVPPRQSAKRSYVENPRGLFSEHAPTSPRSSSLDADESLWSDVPDEWETMNFSNDERAVYEYFGGPRVRSLRPYLAIQRHDHAGVLEYVTELLRALLDVPRVEQGQTIRDNVKDLIGKFAAPRFPQTVPGFS
jgi:hypothetical protein